ncbi:DDE-type integrase/transposase/recombinase [Allomesorhizobium alhagi]|uniref:Putative transposase-related protein n=1 Tax=Mesorhizobium alhagi CCNWXJ12-2 TaxID=1107882 RepID=H0HXB9_9HYPH|nr:putative transposase-related protein [Mesorhizobium alhagi CCNWXJ12-2]
MWLYYLFPLGLRLAEEMLLERGIVVSYETIPRWGKKFGPRTFDDCAGSGPAPMMLAPGRSRHHHRGKGHWLAGCDQDRYVLEEIVRSRRKTKDARRLHQAAEETWSGTKRIITDKLRAYGAAKRQVMPDVEHRAHRGLNNRAENSHVPLRKREWTMQAFVRREACSASSRSSQSSVISSSQLAQTLHR